MPDHRRNEELLSHVLEAINPSSEERAPSRLKATIYSALIKAQQASGPLQSISRTEDDGYPLCVFEKIVQIAPVEEKAKEPFFCWGCHARVLGEKVENAPIFWKHCPYVKFQNR